MCGIARGEHEMKISLQTGFYLQILILKWNHQQRNSQQSPSFSQSVECAIITSAREKWPHEKGVSECQRRAWREGLLTKPGNLNYALLSQCKNVIGHYSWGINSYLSMTHQILNSHDLQCLTSCSNLVSFPKLYVLKPEQIEVVEWLNFSRP